MCGVWVEIGRFYGQLSQHALHTVWLKHFFSFFSITFIILALHTLQLPPGSNSNPGSQSGRYSPLPTTAVRGFVSICTWH